MDKILYFDCSSGVSGDMFLGAFIDLGIDVEHIRSELDKLNVEGFSIVEKKTTKSGIVGTKADVLIFDSTAPPRNYKDIKDILYRSTLSSEIKATAIRIFERIAKAESIVHGVSIDEVHFHEVGAIDSIVDVVGAAICYHSYGIEKMYVSGVNLGSGHVKCEHGVLPVPAPATLNIVIDSDIAIYSKDIETEATTPTGAAIICELCEYIPKMPQLKPIKTAFGFGTKDFKVLNALRIIEGEVEAMKEPIVVLEVNIDDMTGEELGYAMEKLMELGALDISYTPMYMKKNRPAILLRLLCKKSQVEAFEIEIFKHTSTIGIRKYEVERTEMVRHFKKVNTSFGEVTVKVCEYNGMLKNSIEYEDAKKIAMDKDMSIQTVFDLISKEL